MIWARRVGLYVNTVGPLGLLHAIRGKATGSPVLFEVDRDDCRWPFWLRVPSTDVPTYKQVFVDREYDFFAEPPPKIIIDAGANIGLASIYFANRYPDARIIALEPENENFDLLQRNTKPYDNIVPVHAALWHRNEEIDLVDPGLGSWCFQTEAKNDRRGACHTVEGMTVDRVLERYDVDRVDVLKIDIEGAEREVFRNTSAWIDRIDAMAIELHERLKTGCNRSFYNGSNGFDTEWLQGEHVFLSKGNLRRSSAQAEHRVEE